MSQQPSFARAIATVRAVVRRSLVVVVVVVGLLSGAPVRAVNGGACATAYDPVIAPRDFVDARGRPNAIDNAYLPLRPWSPDSITSFTLLASGWCSWWR